MANGSRAALDAALSFKEAPGMAHLHLPSGPAALYKHNHPPVRNVAEVFRERQTVGQRIADAVAAAVGSWPFIIFQSVLLAAWIAVNIYLVTMAHLHPGFLKAWDPYPFILLNLMLSFQAAYTGPVVMMSQNMQASKDRLMAENDFQVNKTAEEEIKVILDHLTYQDKISTDIQEQLKGIQAALAARAE